MPTLPRILLAGGLWVAVPHAAFAEDADAFYKQGLAYKSEGKADQALEALEHAVAANPKHYMAWASLGNLYKTVKKDIPKAVAAYEHAIEGIKKDKVLWANLGMAYYRNQQVDQALKALITASTLDPNDAEIRGNLGTVRRQKGDLPGAIADLEVAVKLKPEDAQYVNNLGVAYRFAKRDDDAIKAFQKAIALAPNDASIHFNLAVAYRRQTEKNPDVIPQAIAEYEKATSLDPGNAEGWFDLGFMYKQDHQNAKAIEAFNRYLELNKGKDKSGQKRVEDEIGAMGGTVPGEAKPGGAKGASGTKAGRGTKSTGDNDAAKKPSPKK
ncbi:MAG TPA: tetratricopeptide repeat protein [Kofleriaceae bacterium]|jgi:Flp pilus assembly protein TadD|nr:tetratricopeptide repeat protein [Kofleriaceae bacterium]